MSSPTLKQTASPPIPRSRIPIESPILPYSKYSKEAGRWNGEMIGATQIDDPNQPSPCFWLSPIAAELALHVYDTSQPLPDNVQLLTKILDHGIRNVGEVDPFDHALKKVDRQSRTASQSTMKIVHDFGCTVQGSSISEEGGMQIGMRGCPSSPSAPETNHSTSISSSTDPLSSTTTTQSQSLEIEDPASVFVALYQYADVSTSPPTKYWFLATRGTATTDDWINNAMEVVGVSDHYLRVAQFARKVQSKATQKTIQLIFCGHSKGGGHAALNSMVTGSCAITFNAAGISELTKRAVGKTIFGSEWRTKIYSDAAIYSFWSSYDPLVNISKYLGTSYLFGTGDKIGMKVNELLGLQPVEVELLGSDGSSGEDLSQGPNPQISRIIGPNGDQNPHQNLQQEQAQVEYQLEKLINDGSSMTLPEGIVVSNETPPQESEKDENFGKIPHTGEYIKPNRRYYIFDILTIIYTILASFLFTVGSKAVEHGKMVAVEVISPRRLDLIRLVISLVKKRSQVIISPADGQYKFSIVHHQDEFLIFRTTINSLQQWYRGHRTKSEVAMETIQTVLDQHSMAETLPKFKIAFEHYQNSQRLHVYSQVTKVKVPRQGDDPSTILLGRLNKGIVLVLNLLFYVYSLCFFITTPITIVSRTSSPMIIVLRYVYLCILCISFVKTVSNREAFVIFYPSFDFHFF